MTMMILVSIYIQITVLHQTLSSSHRSTRTLVSMVAYSSDTWFDTRYKPLSDKLIPIRLFLIHMMTRYILFTSVAACHSAVTPPSWYIHLILSYVRTDDPLSFDLHLTWETSARKVSYNPADAQTIPITKLVRKDLSLNRWPASTWKNCGPKQQRWWLMRLAWWIWTS
jgi:hypothetical protein